MSQSKKANRSSPGGSNSGSSTPSRSNRQSPHSPKEARNRNARNARIDADSLAVGRLPGKELCNYTHRVCLQNRLEGFDYCIRHILVDRSAPFKQCSYIHPHSSKRCPNAARRSSERKDSALCPWHIKKLYLKRKNELQAHRIGEPPPKNLRSFLRDLEHYCTEDHPKRRRTDDWSKQDDETTTATDELREKIAIAAAGLNESDSEDEVNNPYIDESLRSDVIDSDSESIESDQEDPLKHAGVYTAEEASSILAEKMHRLQKLYIEQFRHMRYLMKEKFRKYYLNSLNESNASPAAGNGTPPDANDQATYKAMIRYHKYNGKELLLKRQAKERRRAVTEGRNYQPPTYPVCIYVKDDQACKNRSLPSTHYCLERKAKPTCVWMDR